jgi:uncharacterized membrane protein
MSATAAFVLDAGAFLLRWFHVVAAIAWIGESFYFVALDRGLKAPRIPQAGLAGESWSVHGGGFYHKQKYLPAPAKLPDALHWSKWKSYATWLSGFALFALMYLGSPQLYLIDPAVAALSPGEAAAWALALLALGWIGYDLLCRLVGFHDRLLGLLVCAAVVLLAWGAAQLFSGRGAFLLVGAVLATIMTANVFFVIIPGQKRMVAALARGEAPDPLPGLQGRQRSVHNTYFTLPVVFAMLSVHYPTAWAHPYNWAVLLLFMAVGALVRQFFVLWHGGTRAWWLLGAGAVVLAACLAWLAPASRAPAMAPDITDEPPLADALRAEVPASEAILALLDARCGDCHAATPRLLPAAPRGAVFDTPAQLDAQAQPIHQQTVQLRIMPPGNMTGMTDGERDALDRWYRGRRARQGH